MNKAKAASKENLKNNKFGENDTRKQTPTHISKETSWPPCRASLTLENPPFQDLGPANKLLGVFFYILFLFYMWLSRVCITGLGTCPPVC